MIIALMPTGNKPLAELRLPGLSICIYTYEKKTYIYIYKHIDKHRSIYPLPVRVPKRWFSWESPASTQIGDYLGTLKGPRQKPNLNMVFQEHLDGHLCSTCLGEASEDIFLFEDAS